MKLIDLEKEFEQIICYHINNGELHERAATELRSFIQYLLNQSESTIQRLKSIIAKFNYDTVEPSGKYKIWPQLEFWRGVDDFGTSVALNYDGDVETIENEDQIVTGQFENTTTLSDLSSIEYKKQKQTIKIDLNQHPISLLGYYEYRFNRTALYYAWFGYLWQEIEGYKCGIVAKTIQNNSIATFSLNDFLNGEFSSFIDCHYGEKPPKLENFFSRKLSLIELYLRASQKSYPFNPFVNYCRYFENENEFLEIVTYEFKACMRYGIVGDFCNIKKNELHDLKDSKSLNKYITDFTNMMISKGWIEKLRPLNMPMQMHEEAFDFEIWTGIHWDKEQNNMIPEQRVNDYEKQNNIKLPRSFFHYVRLLNGRQYNAYNMYFPVNDLYTVHVKKFYTIEELEQITPQTLQKDPTYILIGELVDEKKIGIIINNLDENYGKIVIENDHNIIVQDYNFETFAKFAQASPKQPEIFAAEENDAKFLEKRIVNGWDYNTSYRYQNALSQAAEYNSHEALEVLLKAGARLKHNNYKEMTYSYDQTTIEILDRYHNR